MSDDAVFTDSQEGQYAPLQASDHCRDQLSQASAEAPVLRTRTKSKVWSSCCAPC
jgi:hypothetical protein